MTLEARRNANDQLIAGAAGIGAGRLLGLTDEETIATKKATLRRQQRERRAQRGQREGNRAAAEAFLAQDDAGFQQKARADLRELGLGDRARDIDDQAWAFGEDPEYDMFAPDGKDGREQKFRMKGADERMRPQDDGQTYDAAERAYMGIELDADDINDPDVARQSGRYRQKMSPEAANLNKQLQLLRQAAAIGAVEPDVAEAQFAEMGRRVIDANKGQKRKWVEDGQVGNSPSDIKGRIDNANPRQREPGGKEQGFRAMRDAVARLNQANEQYGFSQFGAEGPEMERIAREVGNRADEGAAIRADRNQAEKEVLRDARIRRGDLTPEEMNMAIAQAVRAGRPDEFKVGGDVDGTPERTVNNRGMFDRDVEIASRIEAQLQRRKADGLKGGPEMRAIQVRARAGQEAAEIRDAYGGYFRNMADADIGRIGDVQQLGGVGKASHDPLQGINYRVANYEDTSSFGFATPLMRDGKPTAYYDENMVELGNVNFDSSANGLNAPQLTPVQEWALKYQPDFGKEGGMNFGYPQVGINEELHLLGERIRGLKGFGFEGVSDPRNIQEVEQALGAIVARGKKLGKNFYRPTPEGKNQKIDQPNMNDVLYALGYAQDFDGQPAADKQRLANALIQIQGANQSPVNRKFKEDFAARISRPVKSNVVMDVAEMRPDQGVPLAKIGRNAKVGGKQVNAQLRAISEENILRVLDQNGLLYGPDGQITPEAAQIIVNARDARRDAQQPFMGALAGEEPERARFIRGKDRGQGEAALVKKYGARGLAAAELERRYEEDKAARIASLERRAKPPARQFLDDQFFAQAAQGAKRVEATREGNELAQLAMLVQDGAKFGQGYQSEFGTNPFLEGVEEFGDRALPPAERGRKLVLPNESQLVEPGRFGGGEPKKRRVEPIKAKNLQREEMQVPSPIEIEVGKRAGRGGGSEEFTTPGRAAQMPVPYTPPVVDGNGAPMPKPLYDAGPNPRQIQNAPVAPSIAPDPGVPTGNQAAPMKDAGRPMPSNMRNELFSLPGPYQKKYMSEPDGPESSRSATVRNRKQFRDRAYRNIAMRDAGVVSAGVLGSILGIDALTGNKEEEQV